jgi:hypothetical protein
VTSQQRAEAAARWRALRGGSDPDAEAELYGFFQAFRPHGEGLAEALGDTVGADQILPRLSEVYQATCAGWDPSDAYFIVRRTGPLAVEPASSHALDHARAMGAIAHAMGSQELGSVLSSTFEVSVVATAAPDPSDLDAAVYELISDFMTSLTPTQSDLLLLEEAAYGIAADYYLQYHLFWPLYRQGSTVEEPFLPYFRLWALGATPSFVSRDRLIVHAPGAGA